MKGKGKNKTEIKVKTEAVSDPSAKPPQFSVADVNKCQTYLLGVRKDGSVAFTDLIPLQNELEYMLVCMMKREEQLKTEISNLENPSNKKKRSRSTDSVGKKCAKKSKKCKGSKKNSTPSRPKNKFVQPPPKSFECGLTDAQVEIPKPQKNDGPSRFWAFIQPYCADITQEDIKSIEAWIKSHEGDSEYQKIPELGSHFSKKWTKDDMEEEIKEGSKSVENQKGCFDSDIITSEEEKVLKMGENECKQMQLMGNSSQSSSLVDRLVSTFVQDNVITSLDVCLTESAKDDFSTQIPKRKATTSIANSPKKECLQEKLCKGLSEIGVMEMQDQGSSDYSEDEILAELKRLQKALIPVCNKNLRKKKHLLALAKIEMKKQDVKKKLKEIDAKVMEIYRAIYATRCENKPPPKKHVAQIKKILSDRQKVLTELESMS